MNENQFLSLQALHSVNSALAANRIQPMWPAIKIRISSRFGVDPLYWK